MSIPPFHAKCPFCQMVILNLWNFLVWLQIFLKGQPVAINSILQKCWKWGTIQPKPLLLAVIVSDTYGLNVKCDNKKYVDKFLNFFAYNAGGATHFLGKGNYLSGRGVVSSEDIHLILAFYSSIEEQTDSLQKLCFLIREYQQECTQECIALFVNGEFYLVS